MSEVIQIQDVLKKHRWGVLAIELLTIVLKHNQRASEIGDRLEDVGMQDNVLDWAGIDVDAFICRLCGIHENNEDYIANTLYETKIESEHDTIKLLNKISDECQFDDAAQ